MTNLELTRLHYQIETIIDSLVVHMVLMERKKGDKLYAVFDRSDHETKRVSPPVTHRAAKMLLREMQAAAVIKYLEDNGLLNKVV
jgi:hypothetical protein